MLSDTKRAPATISEELKQKIQQRMQIGTPRFLFRTWHKKSGGHEALNALNTITPLRFQTQPDHCKSFFGNKIGDLVETAEAHLQGAKMPEGTVYSSWTHSLPQAFGWGCCYLSREYTDLHICVLDTRKLPDAQVVLHTRAMHEVLATGISRDFDHELLAYGPIESPVYKAMSCADIEKADLDKFFPFLTRGSSTLELVKSSQGDAKLLLSAAIRSRMRRPRERHDGPPMI